MIWGSMVTSANTGIFANSHSKSTVGLTFFIESSIDFVKLFSVGALHFQGWICDMGIDGPTFVPKSAHFLLIWVKVCPQKLAFS